VITGHNTKTARSIVKYFFIKILLGGNLLNIVPYDVLIVKVKLVVLSSGVFFYAKGGIRTLGLHGSFGDFKAVRQPNP
jgi:hypothetical protein